MDDQPKKFPEQSAPDKNTDRAFVRVSKDGSPELPGKDNKPEEERGKEKPSAPPPRK